MPHGQQTATVNITEMTSDDLTAVDAMLSRTIDRLTPPKALEDAYRYALFSGGKRVRPVMSVLCCEAVGGDRSLSYPSAGAVEMIHAFSLVHDDLPALDDDDLRRGKPTLHKAHGEAMAILAGDGLLTHAFTLLCIEGAQGDATLAGTLCTELASATGAMIDGQVLDTLGGGDSPMNEADTLRTIHEHKTGALITASCRMGAIAGMWPKVDEAKLDAVTAYGKAMGLMFQAVDDLLDVESTPEALGKATQKDAEAGKLTYPGVFGIEGTRAHIVTLRDEALRQASELGEKAEPLAVLCRTLAERGS